MSKLTKASERINSEDALKHIYKSEVKGRRPTVQSVAGVVQLSLDQTAELLGKMELHHLLHRKEGELKLTPEGREYALQIIRAHRLWERYLADETGYDQAEWHDRADRQEHTLSPDETEALSAVLGHPTHDPHGDPIPTAQGELRSHGGRPLTAIRPGQSARIVHLEDEPEVVYAQLVAEGLHPGLVLSLVEVSPQRLRFQTDDGEHILAPIVAANISVVPLSKTRAKAIGPSERLSDLKPGQKGNVSSISPACRGPERRRLMDLGILPGTVIKAEMRSPSGDPTAYLVRGALIALRREQAAMIKIEKLEEVSA